VVHEEKGSAAKARPVLDRLDRDMRECINRMAKLDAYGCKVLSVRGAWVEDAGHTRGLLVGIVGWMNEMERRTHPHRADEGRAHAGAPRAEAARPPSRSPSRRGREAS
jgi:DNA invertase Pin-like site-specific DNA recombinase